MDESVVRRHAEEYAKSVERGDIAAVASGLVPELHDQLPAIASELPNPTKTAEVLSVQAAEDRAGRPLIVGAEPVE
jgi:hypothetical protein